MLKVSELRFSCSLWWQAVPLQSMEVHGGAALGGPQVRARGCPKEAVTPQEVHARAGSWQELWLHGERSPPWSRFAAGTCHPIGDPYWSRLLLKECLKFKGLHNRAEEECEELSLWEGRSSRSNVLWVDHNPHYLSFFAIGAAVGREFRGEVDLRTKGGMGKTCYRIQALFVIILLWFDW